MRNFSLYSRNFNLILIGYKLAKKQFVLQKFQFKMICKNFL
jgi:hypothetical protein